MYTSFSPLVRDLWTPAIGRLPRWYASNGYFDLGDPLILPDVGSAITASITYSTSGVPTAWTLPTYTVNKSNDLLQAFFFNLAVELSYLNLGVEWWQKGKSGATGLTEPNRGYFVTGVLSDGPFYVQTSSGLVLLKEAKDPLEAFVSTEWVYTKRNAELLITGIGIQEFTTTNASGWYRIDSFGKWDPNGLTFVKHPINNEWVPIPEDSVRSDGLIGWSGVGCPKVRSHNNTALDNLPTIIITDGAHNFTGTLVNLWSSLDEQGLWHNLYRYQGESPISFATKLYSSSWFSPDQTKESINNYLATNLGMSSLFSLSRGVTGYIFDSGYTNLSIRNLDRVHVVSEYLTVDASGILRSSYYQPTTGTLYTDYGIYKATNSSGLVLYNGHPLKFGESATAIWSLSLWNATASGITFTSNMPYEGLPYFCLETYGVSSSGGTIYDARKAYTRNSFNKKWTFLEKNDKKVQKVEKIRAKLATFFY